VSSGPAELPASFAPATVIAPAKLTLRLRITGVRADGYHLIDAEMVTLDLADELRFADGDGVDLVDETGRGLVAPPEDDNLVVRALRLVGATARVTVRKRIPLGAGLGGGSADAAAVLRWAGRLDADLAARLGADVPFCLLGGARAHVRGIGEILDPLPPLARTFTLLTPPFGCSTPAVYRAWDELGGPSEATNDLEPAALHVEPELRRWRDRLEHATGLRPVLAGSGSTWFVEGAFPGPGRIVAQTMAAGRA
jgi:4-diphosphocytidyl-2-C-methyl-D-erythritol kinase